MMEHRYPRLFAPLCALALLLAACSGGSDDPLPVPPPAAGDDTDIILPDSPEHEAGSAGGDVSDNPAGETTPTYKYASVSDFLQQNIVNYDELSGKISSEGITLTAQTIDVIIDEINPALAAAVKNSNNEAKAESTFKSKANTDEIKKALIALVGNKLTLTKVAKAYDVYNTSGSYLSIGSGLGYTITTSGASVKLSGTWSYFSQHIESLSSNVDISGATIESGSYGSNTLAVHIEDLYTEVYNKLLKNQSNVSNLPTLKVKVVNVKDVLANKTTEYGLKHFLDIYNKYNKSSKLQVTVSFGEMDGRYLVDGVTPANYTLFGSDGNTVNSSNVKTMDINDLIDFANQYSINTIKNIKINGTLSSAKTVNWALTNVVFETSMANLTNSSNSSLNGVVYFKDLPYNSTNNQSINGVVRYDKLAATINKIVTGTNASIVDMRGIDKDTMNSYNITNIFRGGMSGVYFEDSIKELSRSGSTKNAEFYKKFIDIQSASIYNEYYGSGDREDSEFNGTNTRAASKKARTLKEFEYYGNNSKFEKSAYDSYNGVFTGSENNFKDTLEADKDSKKIASAMHQTPVFFA